MSPHGGPTLWRTQNFLRDPQLVERLVTNAAIKRSDVVYDLGAGSGSLTAALARRGARVIAIEKDPALVARLRRRFATQPNIVVRQADILRHPLPRSDYLVFASPPFDITADLVRKLTVTDVAPRVAHLVLQREAAERYIGVPRMTLSALLIAPWFSIEVVHRFARTDFTPAPSVDIVLVRLHKRGPPLVPVEAAQLFRDFAVSAFASRGPAAAGALAETLGTRISRRLLARAGVSRTISPSTLRLSDWIRLFEHFDKLPVSLKMQVAGADMRLRSQQRRLQKVHRTRVPRDALRRVSQAPHSFAVFAGVARR
jgi:23S rRNA (adenine-N6)-dimethyltransferase